MPCQRPGDEAGEIVSKLIGLLCNQGLRHPLFCIYVVLLAAVVAWPYVSSAPTSLDVMVGNYLINLESTRSAARDIARSELPNAAEITALLEDQADAIEQMEGAEDNIVSLMARWEEDSRELTELGMAYDDIPAYRNAMSQTVLALNDLENPRLYGSCPEEPMLYYFCEVMGSMPWVCWCVSVAVTLVALKPLLGRGRLIEQAPLRQWKKLLSLFAALLSLSLGAILVAWMPVTIAAALRNGWGDLAYPIVNVVDTAEREMVIGTTLSSCFLANLALLLLVTALLCGCAVGLLYFLGDNSKILIALLLIITLPLLQGFVGLPAAVARWSPFTYFDTSIFAGVPTYQGFELLRPDGATWETGSAVVGFLGSALLVSTLTAAKLKPRYRL